MNKISSPKTLMGFPFDCSDYKKERQIRAYREGFTARLDGIFPIDNPYNNQHTIFSASWNNGWNYANNMLAQIYNG
jgi:ribosome modulation factor